MPLFDIEDDNGNILTLEGDSPPTEQELEEIYSQHHPKTQTPELRGPEFRKLPDMQATTRGGPRIELPDFGVAMSDFGGEISENLPGPGAMAYAGGVARSIPADLAAGMSLLKRPEGHKVGLLPASPSEIVGAIKQNLPYSAEASGNIPAALMGKAELPIDFQLSDAASEPGGLAAATVGHISQDVAATAPLLAIGLLPKAAQALVAAGFSAHMVASAPKLFEEYADEINKPEDEQDPDKIAKLQSSIAQTFGFAPLAGKHAASEFGHYASQAFEQANRFAPGQTTGGPRASDVAQPPLEMPMEIRGGDQNASEVSQAAEVHGDVRAPERQRQQEGVPVEEGGAGVQPQAERGILTPDETAQFKELQNKFFGGGDMTSVELDALDAFDARNRATMQARVAGEPPPKGVISEGEELLNKAVADEGISDKINMVEPGELTPDNPMSFRIAQFNLKTGKIDINGREFARALESVPPEQRAKLARVMINEEKIHSFTTPQEAAEFGKNLSWVERKIGNKIYTGKFSGEHPGARMNDMTLGFEVIRRRIQRLNRMSPTEVVRAAGLEKWTVESLDMLDRIVAKSREFLGDTGKAQRAAIDKIRSNIETARKVVAEGAVAGSPAALAKENEPKSVEDFVSRMAGEKFNTIDAVNAGFKAKSIADLEALRKAKADIREQMVEARKSGDFNKAFKLGSDNQMIREALETATSSGSNSVEMRRPHEAHYGEEPALNWKNNPEVRDWLEKHGKEVGIEIEAQSPAALSKKDARRLEELRKYQEAMGKRPAQERMLSKGEAVAPEERVSATEAGALPRISATDMDLKADQILADKITPRKQTSERMPEETYQRWKRKHVKLMGDRDFEFYSKLSDEAKDLQMRAAFSEAKNARQQFDRPGFKEFEQWSKRNLEGVSSHQIRDMWEDSVWSHLVKATPERLEEWRKALGLEVKYGKSRIAPERGITAQQEALRFGGETSAAEANLAAKQFNRQAQIRRAQDLRGIEAADRYRSKIITAIAQKLIGESVKDRAELNRTEVTTDDIDFTNKESKHGPYTEISASDLTDERAIKNILRDQARTSGAPESESKRLVAVVDRKTGAVELVSTYNDAGVQRVTDPAGARLPGKPSRELNRAFLRQYRPFASILLTDPVKGFRQKFESVSEFNEKIGNESKERTSIGEFQGEGPAGEFTAEGTPGLQGEGGSFQGPHRTTMRRGAMESATRLTHPEAEGVLEHVWNEVGDFSSPDDVKMALMGLLDKSARGRMRARDYLAQSAYRKMINALQREFPDRTREEVLDVLADRIYENNRTSETLEQYQQKTVAQFKGQNPEDAGPEAAPEAGTELTMPIERRPPTDVLPENVPPGTPPVERQKPPSARLGSETPVREPYIPEVSPAQEKIQRNAALRAGKEYQVGQDWAAAFRDVQLQQSINKRDIRVVRDRVRREQGVTITPAEAKGILEAKRAFRPPMEMSNRAIFKRAERSLNEPLTTDNPAALSTAREGIDPDTKSPIPRLIPNISTAMTRALGIERIPLIGRLWGERAKIRDQADREMVAYAVKRGIGKSQAAIIGAREAALTKELGNPFEQTPDGKFLNVRADKKQSLYPSDLFEDWQRQVIVPEKMERSGKFSDSEVAEYSEKHPTTMSLTPQQEKLFRQYLTTIEDGYKYLDEKNAKLETYGGESKETRRDQIVMHGLPKGVEVYPMPRLAMYKREIGPIKTEIRKRIGGSYQIEKDRLYKTEADGQRTTAYEPDMNKRLATFVERIYKAVADADLANAGALKGETAEQRIPRLSKEYEMELRTGEMSQRDIVDMGYRPRLGVEGQVSDHPAFSDKIYPIDIANRLNKVFGDRPQRYVRGFAELGVISKTLMLTGDLAQYLQQGSLLATRRPRIWADATLKSITSLADPHVTGNLLRNPENMQAATEFVQGGGSLGHLQDFMSGAKPGEFLTKIPLINQIINRSGRAFGTFQDIAKLEVWKAVRDSTPKEQWPEMIESIEDLGLSGKMENAGMNSARAIGERLLLMAPAYYRGAMNAVARAAEGGKSGAEARRSLFQYAAGWTTLMVGLYVAAGMSKEEIRHRLTPGQNNQKFLKFPVKMGNDTVEVGPGGIILSMLNLGTDMAVTTATKPGDMVSFKNPALKWIQQRLGPIPTFARKVATGEDVFGRSTGPVSATANAIFPIPLQKGVSAAQTANKAAGAVSAVSSFFGLDSKKYKAATDVYQMAEDFMKKEGLKKESGFDSVANEAPSYSKLRGAVGAGSQRRFNDIRKSMTENRTDLDLIKQMKEWRDAPFTGSKKAESLFKAGLSDYETGIYEQAQEERQRVFDDFLDMLSNAP